MKTLNKQQTRKFFVSDDSYNQMVANFKAIASDPEKRKTLEASDYFFYSFLRGKDWTKCFARVLPKDPTFPQELGSTPKVYSLAHQIFCKYTDNWITWKAKKTFPWCDELINKELMIQIFSWKGEFGIVNRLNKNEPYPDNFLEGL